MKPIRESLIGGALLLVVFMLLLMVAERISPETGGSASAPAVVTSHDSQFVMHGAGGTTLLVKPVSTAEYEALTLPWAPTMSASWIQTQEPPNCSPKPRAGWAGPSPMYSGLTTTRYTPAFFDGLNDETRQNTLLRAGDPSAADAGGFPAACKSAAGNDSGAAPDHPAENRL